MQAVLRLHRYLEPLPSHFEIMERIGLILRGGYTYRNSLDDSYRASQVDFYRSNMDRQFKLIAEYEPITAPSASLFGISGVGKSTVVEQTLAFFPRAICHEKHGFIQVPWLKLDCPPGGHLKDLLLGILLRIDDLLGSEYRPHRRSDRTIPELILNTAKVAAAHFLGILVIDEIQNLIDTSGVGPDLLSQFFVMFANVVKIPIFVIGTPRAISSIQRTFHGARRVGDFGALVALPLTRGPTWDFFLTRLFTYQWVAKPITLDDELSSTIFDLTQGVHALVVRLFQLVQIQAIRLGLDTISLEMFRVVASSELQLVEPMLKALRAGKDVRKKAYDDLFAAGLTAIGNSVADSVRLEALKQKTTNGEISAAHRLHVISVLVGLGFEEHRVDEVVKGLFHGNPKMAVADAVAQALEQLQPRSTFDQSLPYPTLKEVVQNAASDERPADALRSAGVIYPSSDDSSPA
ncbi:ATP-binding protein [Microvirga soli]|uniref:ATP-binding protein n=1 Tax=Microvirga soli TaxID=1854496 RepID=UPI00191E8805|nr:ATP-binding protein [Microvirga soli]